MELTDGVVTLRRFCDDDVPRIVEACTDPDTTRFTLHIPAPYGDEDARAYLARVAECWETRERLAFAIADAVSDVLVGAIDVRLGEIGGIGYWMHPDSRGRGMATQALALLSTWALTEGGVERLELITHPENVASQRVAERAGFMREGVLRSHTRFRDGRRDSVLFSLLPTDVQTPSATRSAHAAESAK